MSSTTKERGLNSVNVKKAALSILQDLIDGKIDENIFFDWIFKSKPWKNEESNDPQISQVAFTHVFLNFLREQAAARSDGDAVDYDQADPPTLEQATPVQNSSQPKPNLVHQAKPVDRPEPRHYDSLFPPLGSSAPGASSNQTQNQDRSSTKQVTWNRVQKSAETNPSKFHQNQANDQGKRRGKKGRGKKIRPLLVQSTVTNAPGFGLNRSSRDDDCAPMVSQNKGMPSQHPVHNSMGSSRLSTTGSNQKSDALENEKGNPQQHENKWNVNASTKQNDGILCLGNMQQRKSAADGSNSGISPSTGAKGKKGHKKKIRPVLIQSTVTNTPGFGLGDNGSGNCVPNVLDQKMTVINESRPESIQFGFDKDFPPLDSLLKDASPKPPLQTDNDKARPMQCTQGKTCVGKKKQTKNKQATLPGNLANKDENSPLIEELPSVPIDPLAKIVAPDPPPDCSGDTEACDFPGHSEGSFSFTFEGLNLMSPSVKGGPIQMTEERKDTLTSNSMETQGIPGPTAVLATPQKMPLHSLVQPTPSPSLEALAQPTPPSTQKLDVAVFNREGILVAARLYSLLLLRRAVPSVATEFHLITRFLRVNPNSEITVKCPHPRFARVYGLLGTCHAQRWFAGKTLAHLEPVLICLGEVILRPLLAIPSLLSQEKALVERLSSHLAKTNHAFLYQDTLGGSPVNVPTSSPLVKVFGGPRNSTMALPFREATDSRHNFRSREAQHAYKRREEARDVFMGMVREFQGLRSKLDRDMDGYSKGLRKRVRDLLDSLGTGAGCRWLAEFFVEVLVRLGPASQEEVDEDILKHEVLAKDKDKLQKLHQIMVQSPQEGRHLAKRSSKKLPYKKQNKKGKKAGTQLAMHQPELFFAGNQEFFFLFLRCCDSYVFNSHLTECLMAEISKYSVDMKIQNFVEVTVRLKLCAKFLGVLTFSPNWSLSYSLDQDEEPSLGMQAALDHAVSEVESLGVPRFDVLSKLQFAWLNRSLCITVPWLVSYLSMMQWDQVSLNTSYYCKVLDFSKAILRAPQVQVGGADFTPSVLFVAFELDSLFEELTLTQNHTKLKEGEVNLPTRAQDGPRGIDDQPFSFSNSVIQALCPYLQEVVSLLETGTKQSPTISTQNLKKLRPYVISSVDDDGKLPSPTKDDANMEVEEANDDQVCEELAASFFQVHPALKSVAEFVSETVTKNACTAAIETVLSSAVHQIAGKYKTKLSSYGHDVDKRSRVVGYLVGKIEPLVCSPCEQHASRYCAAHIPKAFAQLVPYNTLPEVVHVAGVLTYKHSARQAKALLGRTLKNEITQKVKEYLQQLGESLGKKKNETESSLPIHQSSQKNVEDRPLDKVPDGERTMKKEDQLELKNGTKIFSTSDLTKLLTEASETLQLYKASSGNTDSTDSKLSDIFQAIDQASRSSLPDGRQDLHLSPQPWPATGQCDTETLQRFLIASCIPFNMYFSELDRGSVSGFFTKQQLQSSIIYMWSSFNNESRISMAILSEHLILLDMFKLFITLIAKQKGSLERGLLNQHSIATTSRIYVCVLSNSIYTTLQFQDIMLSSLSKIAAYCENSENSEKISTLKIDSIDLTLEFFLRVLNHLAENIKAHVIMPEEKLDDQKKTQSDIFCISLIQKSLKYIRYKFSSNCKRTIK